MAESETKAEAETETDAEVEAADHAGEIADGHDKFRAESKAKSKTEPMAWHTDGWQRAEGAITLAAASIRIVPLLLAASSSPLMVCGRVERCF